MELLLFSLSIIPVILIGYFIYKKDKDKERPKLLLKLFLGGIFSCLLVLVLSSILHAIFPFFSQEMEGQSLLQLVISVFIGVALIEEFCKWIMVYKISYNDDEFDHIFDAIVYAVFVALGFAFLENLFYVYSMGVSTGLIRALTAVPAHASFGIFMGYYLGLAKLSRLNNNLNLSRKYIAMSIIVPVVLHGIYDYCLLTGEIIFVLLFFAFTIAMFAIAFKKIKQFTSITRNMKYKDSYCTNCGRIVESTFCPGCGKKND